MVWSKLLSFEGLIWAGGDGPDSHESEDEGRALYQQ
jgi:hypothetical protein